MNGILTIDKVTEKPPTDFSSRIIFWKTDITKLFGVSKRTVDRWISNGTFPKASSHQGGKPFWTRKSLKEFSGTETGI